MMKHINLRWLVLVLAAVVFVGGMISAAPAAAAGVSADPASGGLDTTYTFTANGFQRNEIVDTWIGIPNLSAVSTGTRNADDSGKLRWSFTPKTNYGGGEYIAVAKGRFSGQVSVKFNVATPPKEDTGSNSNNNATAVLAPVSDRTVQFSGRDYQAGELVNTWYLSPNGKVYGYQNLSADAWGNLAFNLTVPTNWMFGGYQLVGRGTRSGNTAYITFSFFGTVSEVRASKPITHPAPYYDFWQSGFTPGEQVSLWIGLPNGTTQAMTLVNANGSGKVYYRVNIPPGWQYGGYIVAAYGWSSHVTQWQRFSYFGSVERLYP